MSHAPEKPTALSVEASPEQQAQPARCALATGSAVCPTCAAELKLKKNGTFPKHRIKRQYFFGTNWHKARPWCITYGVLPNSELSGAPENKA